MSSAPRALSSPSPRRRRGAGAVVGDHPRDAGHPRACTRSRASRRCRQNAARRRRGRRSTPGVPQWPKGSLDTLQRLGSEYPEDPVVQLYLGIACSGPATPRRRDRARGGEEARPRHATGRSRPTTSCTRSSSTELPGLRADAAERAAHAGRARCRPQGHQHSAERLYQRAARLAPGDDEAQVAAAVGRFDKDNLAAVVLAPRPADRALPAQPGRALLPRLLLAWTGASATARSSSSRRPSRSVRRPSLGRSAQAFLDRVRDRWDRPVRRNEPDGLCVRPTRLQQFRIRKAPASGAATGGEERG